MGSSFLSRPFLATGPAILLAACNPNPPLIQTAEPTSIETTATYEALRELPAPKQPVPVAVYSYPDLTGQFKPSEIAASTNSRAVTQGAVWMLVKSLKDAAAGGWFKVIQRANLDNLLKERQIIRETRGRVEKQTGEAQPGLPSLLFAGVILEGGIIGYDSNTVTGGIGARYLGIGGDVQYRQDTVSVYLNAVSSQTGEVLKSVMTRKTVVSYGMRGSVFKFVSFQKLLEGETGYTVNEPGQIALAQSIEHAVRSLIIEGALEGLWQFEDEIAGKEVTQAYLADREDDLLIGDSTSLVAQTLLNEEQLEKIADARNARRQRLEEQDLRRQERQLAAERKKAEEEAAQRELASVQTATPDDFTGPIATPAQLATLQKRFGVDRAGASADAITSEQREHLVGLAAAEAEFATALELGIPKPKADQKSVSEENQILKQDKADAEPAHEQALTNEDVADPKRNLTKEGPKVEDPEAKAGVTLTSRDEKDPHSAAKKRSGPLPLTIKQPDAVIDREDDEADEANLLDNVPKLRPASGNGVSRAVAVELLGLGGQTVKASRQ